MCGEGGVPFDARLGGSDAASLPEPPATTGCACRAGASPRGHLGLVTLAMLALAVIRRRR
jgi:MYXO-CTERM domain-containing protein